MSHLSTYLQQARELLSGTDEQLLAIVLRAHGAMFHDAPQVEAVRWAQHAIEPRDLSQFASTHLEPEWSRVLFAIGDRLYADEEHPLDDAVWPERGPLRDQREAISWYLDFMGTCHGALVRLWGLHVDLRLERNGRLTCRRDGRLLDSAQLDLAQGERTMGRDGIDHLLQSERRQMRELVERALTSFFAHNADCSAIELHEPGAIYNDEIYIAPPLELRIVGAAEAEDRRDVGAMLELLGDTLRTWFPRPTDAFGSPRTIMIRPEGMYVEEFALQGEDDIPF